jgi:hypothetical protein
MMSQLMEWMERLLQLGRDVGELAVEGRANRVHGRNNHDRNASRDQAVFDCSRTGLVLEKRENLGHLRTPDCLGG